MESFLVGKKRKLSPDVQSPAGDGGDEPTDVKLALLSSLYPNIDQETLLDVLLAHDGSVAEASASLKQPHSIKKTAGIIGTQSSLRHFAVGSALGGNTSPTKKLMTKKGSTLHLYDPADVAEHTPCTIIHNFLPTDDANDLLSEMLDESKSFEKITFKLFENIVASPHTSCFFVESYEEIQQQKTAYLYNGARLSVFSLLPGVQVDWRD